MTVIAASGLGLVLPLLLVLACPLMMFVMMRGMHGSHGDRHGDADQQDTPMGYNHRNEQEES